MDETFWALIGLVLFLGLMVYIKVPGVMAKSLDKRADNIRAELNEAKRLREEAQALLAEYQKKRKEAEAEAAALLAAAEREAALLTEEARQKTEEFVARRNALSEQKIKQAEADAITAVKSAAIDIAVEAAGKVIASKTDKTTQTALFKDAVAKVQSRLN
jgi:F-type H+-transporting ATPase subunit b